MTLQACNGRERDNNLQHLKLESEGERGDKATERRPLIELGYRDNQYMAMVSGEDLDAPTKAFAQKLDTLFSGEENKMAVGEKADRIHVHKRASAEKKRVTWN